MSIQITSFKDIFTVKVRLAGNWEKQDCDSAPPPPKSCMNRKTKQQNIVGDWTVVYILELRGVCQLPPNISFEGIIMITVSVSWFQVTHLCVSCTNQDYNT